MLALYPLWRKARRVYSLTSRLPGTNRLGFQPSLALSGGWRINGHRTTSNSQYGHRRYRSRYQRCYGDRS
ncbi:MAG: hypothetical protein ABW170_18170 [Candidatus Thiodiazotropha sp. L084R]